MALRLYNTLTRRKGFFVPLDRERVRLYVCGPTVYDRAHIGNARPVIVFDVLFRLLRQVYGPEHVTYARNITDIDDKIIERAAARGISIRDLTEATAQGFAEDVDALGCLRPTVEPRATDHIPEMIALVERLISSGHAYAPQGRDSGGVGHVLFSIDSMPRYGELSRRRLDDLMAGARVEIAPYKEHEADFILWKPSTDDEPGWDSPWGRGRPGWHLECSAMSWKHLGETFDIHGGGIDLIFPHHENEIAQSCCAFHQPFMAQTWMHNGYLQVEGRKMSKSTGNFITIRDLLETSKFGGRAWPGEVLRLAMLRTHYRKPIDWTVRSLEESAASLNSWMESIGDVDLDLLPGEPDEEVLSQLSNDLNTPGVIAVLDRLANEGRGNVDAARSLARTLSFLGLDLELKRAERTLSAGMQSMQRAGRYARQVTVGEMSGLLKDGVDFAFVNSQIEQRLTARREKRWVDSDRIRDELAAMGVVLKDNKDGTTSWDVGRKGTA